METASLNHQTVRSPLIFWVDGDLYVCRANATALTVMGLSAEAIVGQPMEALCVAGSRERLKRAQEGQRLLMELRRANGRRLLVAYSVHRKDGLSVHTATPIGDASLDELIEERIQEERRAAHCELLGHISHNVNNLLTTILSPAQLLLENTQDPDAREDIVDILQATQRARTLLREMYRAVRFEAESMESMRLEPLLADIVGRPLIDALDIQLTLQFLPTALGVSDGLRTILHTLLSNAAEAGATRIHVRASHHDDRILIEVEDNGSGIKPRLLSRIFEPFATDNPRVGAGLSLATTRTRLLGWGGNISVQSTVDTGSTFTISLQTAPPPVQSSPTIRGRVLLVEDERIIARAIRRILSSHDVDIALTARSALQMFSTGTYDTALINLGLPEMSGDELAKELHARDPAVSLLMLTGWMLGQDDPRMNIFEGRIQKPIDDLPRVRLKLQDAIQRTRDRRS